MSKPRHEDGRSLVAHLRDRRMDLGLTQTEIAKRTGINQSTVSDWDRGDVSPMLSSFVRYAAVLGYHVALVPCASAEAVGVC